MNAFTPLERAAIAAILDQMEEHRATVERQLLRADVLSRENTGRGFFAKLEADPLADRLEENIATLGRDVWIGIDGLDYGLGMILHVKDGRVVLLEGYAVGPENTARIDFGRVRFAVVDEPGPLLTDGD